jgi:hypothetical protein
MFGAMAELPNGIGQILEHLADMAAGYGNHLKWNEVAKLKADLMNVRHRWAGVPIDIITARCLELGMRPDDVDDIKDLLVKAQSGRRLIPQKSYRDFRFRPEVQAPTTPHGLRTSRSW